MLRVPGGSWEGGPFLMGEVPLHHDRIRAPRSRSIGLEVRLIGGGSKVYSAGSVKGYLAHKKTPNPLGPP